MLRIIVKGSGMPNTTFETVVTEAAVRALPLVMHYIEKQREATEQGATWQAIRAWNPWHNVGSALKIVRFLRHESQEQLAARLAILLGQEVPQSYLSKVENNHTTLSPERLTMFCECLGWPVVSVIAVAEFLVRNHKKDERSLLGELQELLTKRIESRGLLK